MTKLIFFFLIGYSSVTWAGNLDCKPFHLVPSNILETVSVFNARYVGDSEAAELIPRQTQRGYVMTNYWDLDAYRDLKLFVTCIYKDNIEVTHELDKSIDICRYIFAYEYKTRPPNPVKTSFHCYKKNNIDTLVGKFCEAF
jgi:hypothetical protein